MEMEGRGGVVLERTRIGDRALVGGRIVVLERPSLVGRGGQMEVIMLVGEVQIPGERAKVNSFLGRRELVVVAVDVDVDVAVAIAVVVRG